MGRENTVINPQFSRRTLLRGVSGVASAAALPLSQEASLAQTDTELSPRRIEYAINFLGNPPVPCSINVPSTWKPSEVTLPEETNLALFKKDDTHLIMSLSAIKDDGAMTLRDYLDKGKNLMSDNIDQFIGYIEDNSVGRNYTEIPADGFKALLVNDKMYFTNVFRAKDNLWKFAISFDHNPKGSPDPLYYGGALQSFQFLSE